jgi:hypothetical protein
MDRLDYGTIFFCFDAGFSLFLAVPSLSVIDGRHSVDGKLL